MTGTLTFFDVATGSSLGAMNVSSGGDLSSIAYDPTGSTIYVTSKSASSVIVIDVASQTELGTIPVGAGPQRIALTPSGNKAVVTNNASNTVSIYDITLQAGLTPTFGAVTRTADGYTVQVTNFDADYVWGTSTSMGAASINSSGLVTVSDLAPGGSSIVTVSTARFMHESGSASASGIALDAATIPLFNTPESKADGFDVEILNWNPIDTWTISTSAGVASAIVSKVVTITGLAAGQSATVTAVTSKPGSVDGEASVTGRATTGVPSAPTIFLVGAGDRRATVTWLAPGSDGGSVILDYTVTATPGDRFCTTPDDETTSCIVTGLTNGVAYTFTVTARNDVGSSPPSAASAPITPRPEPVAPGAPTGVVGVAGNGQIEVSWLAPTNNGGSVIEGYQVQVALTESGAYTDAAGGCALARTESWAGVECQATGLVNGQTYSFKVRAQNGVGWGTYSLASNGIAPIGPPAPVPPSPSPGGGGSSSPGGSDPSDPTPAPPLPEAPAAPSTKNPDQPGASKAPNPKPVTRNVTIRFTSGSAQLSVRSKQALNRVARESRQARKAKTVAAARLTPAGATSANRVLARQRTTAVCSYLRSANIHGSCSTKTWILKPGQKGVGPSIRVRLQATPR
jgi:YVTN family beta-propeller protein